MKLMLGWLYVCILLIFAAASAPARAAVTIVSFTPSQAPPQPIGKSITWTTTATDSNPGPLTFRFSIQAPGASAFAVVKDFNVGTLSSGTWTARPFLWVPTGVEGTYKIRVVISDFNSHETATRTVSYQVSPVVGNGQPHVARTANPLVALFSAPSCAAGSTMRVVFQPQSGTSPAVSTNYMACHPPASMTFQIAGMYPSTTYNMFSQTRTGAQTTNGPTLTFTTGPLPSTLPFPTFTPQPAGSDMSNKQLLHSLVQVNKTAVYPTALGTDTAGRINWFYASPDAVGAADVLLRPLSGGGFLLAHSAPAWNPSVVGLQYLRQIDLAGNIVRETNTGIIQHQLVSMGAVDGGACDAVQFPPQVGASCLGAFHHEAIQTLPNGYTAALLDIERIFPAGTQGDTSGLPVDLIGDMIVVLDTNWQVVWYWDSFNPAGGGNGYPLLPVTRTAPLGETCGPDTPGCPFILLLDPGNVAPLARDWLHGNSIYYWPNNGSTTSQPGDLIWSSRSQDWIFKIDYKDGTGTGDVLWRMGPSGDFTFNNTYNDPWPWHSHQHDAGIENGGRGQMTIFDNGSTRISDPGKSTGGVPGLGANCGPYDCNSRVMGVTFDEAAMTVTPVVSLDLGGFSNVMGSTQLLSNGNYFAENPVVFVQLNTFGHSQEIGPTPPAPQVGSAAITMDVKGPGHYRGWQLPNLYNPPTT